MSRNRSCGGPKSGLCNAVLGFAQLKSVSIHVSPRGDAERTGRELMQRCARLAAVERAAIELVDLAGLTPKEGAKVLGISPGALRVRLFRARARLRKEQTNYEQV